MADEEQVPGSEAVEQPIEAPVEIASELPKESVEPSPAAAEETTAVIPDPAPVVAVTEAAPADADAAAPVVDPVAIATEMARARAAALAAQFTAGHGGGAGAEAETSKRFREFEEDENSASKRLNSEHTMSFLGALASVGAGGETNEVLHIPSGKVGKLIGKGGSTIKDIQARGGARVKIDHESTGETRMVTIIGTPDQVALTKKYIFETIDSTDSHAPSSFGAPSPGAFGGGGSFSSIGAPGVAGEENRKISCPSHIVGRIIGRGGETIRSLQTASNARITINQNFPEGQAREIDINGAAESVARAHEMIMEIINSDGNATTQTVIQKFGQGITKEIECPKHMVGRIIGKGGETVKGLQRQFAASIQIEQNATPCKVTIIGPPEAVMAAEQAVMALMDDRPQMGGHMGGHMGGYGGGRPGGFGAPPYGGAPGGYGAPYGGYGGAPGGYGGYPGAQHGYGGGYPGGHPAPGGYVGYPAQPAYGGYPQPGAAGGYGAADPYAAAGGYPGAAQQQQQQPASGAASGAPPASASSVWSEMKDDQNRSYYYNSQTGVSQWERPAEMQ